MQEKKLELVQGVLDRLIGDGGTVFTRRLRMFLDDPGIVEAPRLIVPVTAGVQASDYADEEVPCTASYPPGWQLATVAEQAAELAKLFPGLDVTRVEELAARWPKELFEGWDGLGVIPKFAAVTKGRNGMDMRHAFLGALKAHVARTDRAVLNRADAKNLVLDERTGQAYARLERSMPGDVLVLPVQTGMRHRGRSPRRARACLQPGEFALDPFAVGCLVRTHPGRLQSHRLNLRIDCPGATYKMRVDGGFNSVLRWAYWDRHWSIQPRPFSVADPRCGSATALLPPELV